MNDKASVAENGPRVGADLERLRRNAHGGKLNQAKLADLLKADKSRISRIETGEIIPDSDEVIQIAEAIGTSESKDYAAYHKEQWTVLEKPPFWHPSRKELAQAEGFLSELDHFATKPQTTEAGRAQANLYRDTILAAAEYLRSLEHSVSFVGEIGVGKSSAICGLTGLLLPPETKAGAPLSRRVALEAGSGRTTLCEVQLKAGANHE
jgi:transcriptional regulator with XRE-family HTH domain